MLRVHLRINKSGQASRHELDHGDLDEGFGGFGVALEVLAMRRFAVIQARVRSTIQRFGST
jgi:hypothetical protein